MDRPRKEESFFKPDDREELQKAVDERFVPTSEPVPSVGKNIQKSCQTSLKKN